MSCCGTRLQSDFTPDVWPHNRPDLNHVDYRLWTVIQECVYQKQRWSSNIVDELWLVAVNRFHKVGYRNIHQERWSILLQFCCKFTYCVAKLLSTNAKLVCDLSINQSINQSLFAQICNKMTLVVKSTL